MHDIMEHRKAEVLDLKQKSRIRWTVDGDENSKFFHGHINYAIRLEAPFTIEEVKAAVWACGSEKAPGPDGFTFKFIKHFWGLLCGDIMKFVRHFEDHGSISNGCNSSLITLVPKCKYPTSLVDFRPISLIGCLYKIIPKTLAGRIKQVIGTVVSEVQSAYVVGRNILDGPLIVNEVCTWAKNTDRKVLLFKVDFDKAFDSVNWGYLDSMLMQMGFGSKWRSWIRSCLSSSRSAVVVNGCPIDEFNVSKGVRQGDPLSPFLFIVAMEGLHVAMEAAKIKGIFKGVSIPNCDVSLSYLFYADDTLFMGEWSKQNIKNLARILRCFHVSSGLKPVIERFEAKLSSWKSKCLYFGGRLTLVKFVLGNLPIYYLSLFKAPSGVLVLLEKIRRRFLWGGTDDKRKIHWVSWEKVLAPKDNGGLGIGSIYALNIGLIVKCNALAGVWNNIFKAKKDILKVNLNFYDIFTMEADPNVANMETWRCSLTTNGSYTVEALRRRIDQNPCLDGNSKATWCREIPIKVLGFVWRAVLGRIPSADALSSRGVPVLSVSCGMCGEVETADHILISCRLASRVREWIYRWCGISFFSPTSSWSLLDFVKNWGMCPKKRLLLTMIIYGLFWSLWKARNDRVFKKRIASASWIFDDVMTSVFMWAKHRGKWGSCNWSSWCVSPFSCM
ncbi:hypothetical protein L2E82_20293 [Cichorium intybus]|uniref:Uncharacterized protein n=1 Tax=Cichorium intybus TaxID=13427 RepID=A0ACB9DSY0_CICIN|nr:hypothetical protein L2E82_20293 [Cichorium intybus]